MRLSSDRVRSIAPKEVRTIKGATAAAYDLAGGVSVVCHLSRASVSQLSKYASFNEENAETLIPLDVAVEVDRAAGSPVILGAYAQVLGLALVPIASETDTTVGDDDVTMRDGHMVSKHAVELAHEIFEAHEDGRVDPLERKRIKGKIYELKRCLNNVLRRIGGDK